MPNLKMLKFAIIFILIVLVFVQVRIEIYKRRVDNCNECNYQTCLDINFEYNNVTLRIILVIMCLACFISLYWLFVGREIMENLVLGRLRIMVIIQLIFGNLIPMIFIKRNPNIYKFCFKQLNLICWCRNV